METANPYTPPKVVHVDPVPKGNKSIGKRLLIGFGVGASLPASLGTYGLYQFNVYVASLPPDQYVCGNATLGPMFLIMFGAPILGLVGAVVAAVIP